MIWVFSLLFILHILCILFTFYGINTGLLDIHRYMFFVVVFLPFWGFISVLVLHFQVFIKADNKKKIQVEKLKLESEIYKSVTVDSQKNTGHIIPLEEALLINSPKERREIIMDVLNDNPKEYIEFLQKAGNNDDTEVVHYAVTAMVEISKENDFKLQQFGREYSANPDDFDLLSAYADFLWETLDQNLMSGQVEVMNRNLFSELVKKKIAVKESFEDYVRLVKNSLKLENYTQAGETLKELKSKWRDDERIILLELQYYSSLGRGEDIQKLIDEVEKRRVYLSSKAKEELVFWRN